MRAAVAHDSQIDALVLIAGGLGDIAEGQEYGVLNSTFPKNLARASIAWWMLAVGLIGLLPAAKNLPRLFETKIRLREALAGAFGRKELSIAIVAFLVLFAVANLLEAMLNINLRIVSPIFRGFSSGRRIFAFLTFVPFFLAYFVAEGLYLHEFNYCQIQGSLTDLRDYGKAVFSRIIPFVAVICLQYMPKVLFNIWIMPSFVGFLVECLWLIVPVFIITTTCSWWLYRNTKKVGTGAVFNALMMAWVASIVFPF